MGAKSRNENLISHRRAATYAAPLSLLFSVPLSARRNFLPPHSPRLPMRDVPRLCILLFSSLGLLGSTVLFVPSSCFWIKAARTYSLLLVAFCVLLFVFNTNLLLRRPPRRRLFFLPHRRRLSFLFSLSIFVLSSLHDKGCLCWDCAPLVSFTPTPFSCVYIPPGIHSSVLFVAFQHSHVSSPTIPSVISLSSTPSRRGGEGRLMIVVFHSALLCFKFKAFNMF